MPQGRDGLPGDAVPPEDESRRHALRSIMVVIALVLIGAAAGLAFFLRSSSSNPERYTQADANAAIIPLSDMPTGTAQTSGVDLHISCSTRPFDTPTARAQATYRQPHGPSVGEAVNIYEKGTALRIMANVREQWSCPSAYDTTRNAHWNVATLSFPALASDQSAVQISTQPPDSISTLTIDIITMRVNTSSVLIVSSGSDFGAPDIKGTEAFTRWALSRAKSRLGS